MAPVLHHRQQGGHHRCVRHHAGHRSDHKGHQGDQAAGGPDPLRGDQCPQTIEGAAFEQSCRNGEQAQQGDQCGAAESSQCLLWSQNARGHQQADAEKSRELRCQGSGDEQHHGQNKHGKADQGLRVLEGADQLGHSLGVQTGHCA